MYRSGTSSFIFTWFICFCFWFRDFGATLIILQEGNTYIHMYSTQALVGNLLQYWELKSRASLIPRYRHTPTLTLN